MEHVCVSPKLHRRDASLANGHTIRIGPAGKRWVRAACAESGHMHKEKQSARTRPLRNVSQARSGEPSSSSSVAVIILVVVVEKVHALTQRPRASLIDKDAPRTAAVQSAEHGGHVANLNSPLGEQGERGGKLRLA